MVLGIIPDACYQLRKVTIESGDMLVLFSDGVTEARNNQGQELGEKGLAAFLRKHCHQRAEQAVLSLSEEVRRWCESTAFSDDFTIVLVKRL
jgi:phosphoserine phosphatase RsbU/P